MRNRPQRAAYVGADVTPIAPVCYGRAGARKGAFLTGDIRGFVDGHLIRFRSSHKYEGSYVNYDFSGAFENGRLHGQVEDMSTIDPGEFGEATWSPSATSTQSLEA